MARWSFSTECKDGKATALLLLGSSARLLSVLRPLTSPAGEGIYSEQGPPDLRSSLACWPRCPGLDSQAPEAMASAPSAVVGVVPLPGLRLRFPQWTRIRWFYSQCGRAASLKL